MTRGGRTGDCRPDGGLYAKVSAPDSGLQNTAEDGLENEGVGLLRIGVRGSEENLVGCQVFAFPGTGKLCIRDAVAFREGR